MNTVSCLTRKKVGIIVAIGIGASGEVDNVIGSSNTPKGLPEIADGEEWNLKTDLKNFFKETKNNPVVMGSKTAEVLRRNSYFPLPHRENIVISTNPLWGSDLGDTVHFHRASNLFDAISIGQGIKGDTIWVIGGVQIYYQALTSIIIDIIVMTKVQGSFQGDTFFPMEEFNKIQDLYTFPTAEIISVEIDNKNSHKYHIMYGHRK